MRFDDAAPQCKPCISPGPVAGQVQNGSTLRSGQAASDVDDLAAQGGRAGGAVGVSGEHSCSAQQVVGDGGTQHPGRIGAEAP